jgi:hypothetical protein
MKNMAQWADKLAPNCHPEAWRDQDSLRDALDMWTGGDLDCVELDLLIDCVSKRLKAKQ